MYVNVYDCRDLAPVKEFPIDFLTAGSAASTESCQRILRGGGKDKKSEQEFNWIHKFTLDFVHRERSKSQQDDLRIQAAAFADGFFWLGVRQDRTCVRRRSDRRVSRGRRLRRRSACRGEERRNPADGCTKCQEGQRALDCVCRACRIEERKTRMAGRMSLGQSLAGPEPGDQPTSPSPTPRASPTARR